MSKIDLQPWTTERIICGVLIVALIIVTARLFARRDRQNKIVIVPTSLVSSNQEILIQGWTEQELQTILGDFSRRYGIPAGAEPNIQATPTNVQRITFPSNWEPRLLFFLVNYLNYPKGFDLTHRVLGIVGKTRLLSNDTGPTAVLNGQQAIVYVPENDREYDVVYVHLVSGNTYKVPFTTMQWEAVGESRLPHTATALSNQ